MKAIIEISVISPGLDPRPFIIEQGFVAVQDEENVLLKAPKDSHNMRAAERGITQSTHKFSFSQLVHGPSTKTRVAYILAVLREPAADGNESSVMEDEEEESDVEDGDISMLNTESLLQAIDVLKREVQRQREEKEVLEANVREQVVSEVMEVISEMEAGFSEALEAERALTEESCENKISILQKHRKIFYSGKLKERDQVIESLSAALDQIKAGEAPAPPPRRCLHRMQRWPASAF